MIYTRWGNSSCPDVQGTQLVYAGRVGGSFANRGGAANHLCMPLDPEYTLLFRSGVQGYSLVYGAEYKNPLQGTDDHNVPCAVCTCTTRGRIIMIPAKTSCPDDSWSKEYDGYLMSERMDLGRGTFECIDKSQQVEPT